MQHTILFLGVFPLNPSSENNIHIEATLFTILANFYSPAFRTFTI